MSENSNDGVKTVRVEEEVHSLLLTRKQQIEEFLSKKINMTEFFYIYDQGISAGRLSKVCDKIIKTERKSAIDLGIKKS